LELVEKRCDTHKAKQQTGHSLVFTMPSITCNCKPSPSQI